MKKAIFLFSFIHFCYLSFAYEKLDSVLMADLNPEFNTTKALNNDCLEQECTKLKIIEYVERNKKYPVISKKNNITGRVIVKFIHDEIGYNYRMPNINAVLGCAQMEKISEFLIHTF